VQKIFFISAILAHLKSFLEYLWHQDGEARKANDTAKATTMSFSSSDLEERFSEYSVLSFCLICHPVRLFRCITFFTGHHRHQLLSIILLLQGICIGNKQSRKRKS